MGYENIITIQKLIMFFACYCSQLALGFCIAFIIDIATIAVIAVFIIVVLKPM